MTLKSEKKNKKKKTPSHLASVFDDFVCLSGTLSPPQGEYDSPGDDMNDRKVSLSGAALRTLDV